MSKRLAAIVALIVTLTFILSGRAEVLPSIEHIKAVMKQARRHGTFEIWRLNKETLREGTSFGFDARIVNLKNDRVQRRKLVSMGSGSFLGTGSDLPGRHPKWFDAHELEVRAFDLATKEIKLVERVKISHVGRTFVLLLSDESDDIAPVTEVTINAAGGTNNVPIEAVLLRRYGLDPYAELGVWAPTLAGAPCRIYIPPGQYDLRVRWLDQQTSEPQSLDVGDAAISREFQRQ